MTSSQQPRCVFRALLMTALLAVTSVQGQESSTARIGYVDMKRLLDNAPQVTAGRQRLEREFSTRDLSLKNDEKRLTDLRDRLKTPIDGDAEAAQREIDALDRSIKRQREQMRTDLKSRSDQELDASWRVINDAVVEFAREQGYDLIVPSPVVFASAKVDVTDQVLDRLRRKAKSATP